MTQALLVAHAFLWIGFIALLVIVFALTRQVGILFERIAPAGALGVGSRLGAGDPAPDIALTALSGNPVDLGEPSEGRVTLVLFVAPDCPICKHLLPVTKSLARRNPSLRMLYASAGADMQAHEAFAAAHGLPLDSYVVSDALGMAVGVAKLPFAAVISAQQRIAALGLVNTREHLESLLEAERTGVASVQEFMVLNAFEANALEESALEQEETDMGAETVTAVRR